jgi:hypothetical protein
MMMPVMDPNSGCRLISYFLLSRLQLERTGKAEGRASKEAVTCLSDSSSGVATAWWNSCVRACTSVTTLCVVLEPVDGPGVEKDMVDGDKEGGSEFPALAPSNSPYTVYSMVRDSRTTIP